MAGEDKRRQVLLKMDPVTGNNGYVDRQAAGVIAKKTRMEGGMTIYRKAAKKQRRDKSKIGDCAVDTDIDSLKPGQMHEAIKAGLRDTIADITGEPVGDYLVSRSRRCRRLSDTADNLAFFVL